MASIREDPNVKMARNRFKNVLKHLVQDNFMQEEESDSDTEENRLYRYKLGRTGPGQSLSRLSFRFPGPKRPIKTAVDPPKPQPSFVMKLFDRGVDLAQFDDTTPLYPICRAWMQNKPHNKRTEPPAPDQDNFSDISDVDYREETDEIYRLPSPEPLPMDEEGNSISIRVPPPLPRLDDEFDINYVTPEYFELIEKDDDCAPSPALLFQNHLDRWNLIRQRWREAAAYNERRYDNSFAILRAIHDRAVVKNENFEIVM